MSTHPNVMLQCVLTVDEGSRKTERCLMEEFSKDEYGIDVGGRAYTLTVMEDEYDEGYQIEAEEGQIVLHTYLTYGYGESVSLDELDGQVEALKAWAESAKEKHKFSYAIRISANYW